MDLHAPLGSEPRPPRARHPVRWVAAGAGVTLVCFGVWFLVSAPPRGGEPYAVALIPPAPPPKPDAPLSKNADPMPTGSVGPPDKPQGDTVRVENGVKVVSPAETERQPTRGPGPLVIDVSKALDNAHKTTVANRGRQDGRPAVPNETNKPRVAIFVGGLGLSEGPAQAAAETMPAAVTLAFVPYGTNVGTAVAMAKARGHEVLLQLPMQSAQGTTSGPHTLRTTETGAELAADLAWLTSRFDGYVGVTNLLGAPVTANSSAMTTILKNAGAHGVFYVDDGTSRRSLAVSIGAGLGVPTLQADVVLDATNDPAVVQANLEKLATIARTKGSAIGMASGLSDHLSAVSSFAKQLDARGLSLVPLSSIARERTNLATSR